MAVFLILGKDISAVKSFNHRPPQRRGSQLAARAMLWPSLLGIALFFVLPFGIILYYSLIDNPFTGNFVFLDNFADLLQNRAFRLAAGNTAMFSLIAVPLAVVLPLLLAMALESRIPFQSKLRTLFLSPIMVPVVSVVLVWEILFNQNGAVNEFLSLFGVSGVDWLRSGWDKAVVVLLFLWKNLGYNMVLFLAALSNIPREVVETAQIDGAGGWRVFWHIRLRYLSPTLLFVAVLSMANSFKIFREVYLLSGRYPSEGLYMLQHFMNNLFRSLDYPTLSAATLLMALVLGGILAALFALEEKCERDVEE